MAVPIVLPDGSLYVPAVLTAPLALNLDTLITVLNQRTPASARQPRPTPVLIVLRDAAKGAAAEHARQQHRAAAGCADQFRPVAPAQRPAFSGAAVTTGDAARVLGVSQTYVRRMVATGRLRGYREASGWKLDRSDVTALSEQRWQREHGGDPAGAGGGPGTAVA